MNIGTVVAVIMIIGLIIYFDVFSRKSRNRSTGNYHSSSGIFGNWSEKRRMKREEKERRRDAKLRRKNEKMRRKTEDYRMKEGRRYNRGNKMIGVRNGRNYRHDSRHDNAREYNPSNSIYNNRRHSHRYSHQPRYNDDGYDEDGNFRFREGTSLSYRNRDDMYVPTMGDRIKDTVGAVTSGVNSVKHRVKVTKETAEYTGEKLSDLKESTIAGALGVYNKSVHYMEKSKEAWNKSEKFRNATGRVFKRTARAAVSELKETAKNIKDMKARDREKESKKQSNKQSNKDSNNEAGSDPNNQKNKNMESMEEFED